MLRLINVSCWFTILSIKSGILSVKHRCWKDEFSISFNSLSCISNYEYTWRYTFCDIYREMTPFGTIKKKGSKATKNSGEWCWKKVKWPLCNTWHFCCIVNNNMFLQAWCKMGPCTFLNILQPTPVYLKGHRREMCFTV